MYLSNSPAISKTLHLAQRVGAPRPRAPSSFLHEAQNAGEVLTGILYVDSDAPTFIDMLKMVDEPLARLPQDRVRPTREALELAIEELR